MDRNQAPSKIEVNHIVTRKKTADSTHGTRMHLRMVCGLVIGLDTGFFRIL